MAQHYLRSIPAALTMCLLVGASADMLCRPGRGDAEPYHKRVRDAAAKIPMSIGDWRGSNHEVTRAAVALLRPNVILQRVYANEKTGAAVTFLLVHCKDARDMVGHYPPACYPSHGWKQLNRRDMEYEITTPTGKQIIPGTEYEFGTDQGIQTTRLFVEHLIILPDGRLVRRVEEINAAEADFVRRFYGAAQIQLIFDGSLDESARRAILNELISANLGLIDALRSGGKR